MFFIPVISTSANEWAQYNFGLPSLSSNTLSDAAIALAAEGKGRDNSAHHCIHCIVSENWNNVKKSVLVLVIESFAKSYQEDRLVHVQILKGQLWSTSDKTQRELWSPYASSRLKFRTFHNYAPKKEICSKLKLIWSDAISIDSNKDLIRQRLTSLACNRKLCLRWLNWNMISMTVIVVTAIVTRCPEAILIL